MRGDGGGSVSGSEVGVCGRFERCLCLAFAERESDRRRRQREKMRG